MKRNRSKISQIPLCPKKEISIKKKIMLKKEIPDLKLHIKPFTPKIKAYKIDFKSVNKDRNFKVNNNSLKLKKNNSLKIIIPKSISHLDIKKKKETIFEKPKKIFVGNKNIKQYNFQKTVNFHKKENNDYMSTTNSNTKTKTNSMRMNSDVDKIESKEKTKFKFNILEFTFGDINIVKNYFDVKMKKNKSSIKKGIFNNKVGINKKIKINNNNKEEIIKSLYTKLNHRSFSEYKNEQKITKNIITFPKIDNKGNMEHNEQSPKIFKKKIKLIPVNKQYNLAKKHKLIIKQNNFEKDKNNIKLGISLSTKNKDKHKLFIKPNSAKKNIKCNKSSPKLFIKHPSLKKFFEL